MKKIGMVFLIAIFGLTVLGWKSSTTLAAPAPQADIFDEVLLENGYRVAFDEVDYHEDGTSTWFYTLEELPSAQDLSNWVLETPFCAPIMDAGPEPWEIVDPDPNAHLSGVKWQTGAGFQQGQFWVRLDTSGGVGVTNVAAKGPDLAFGEIAGPTCEDGEPPIEPPSPPVVDEESPTIAWVGPVGEDERYDLQDGESVELVVAATDNVAVERVVFLRWDADNKTYVTIAEDQEAPFQATVSAGELNPTWNHVLAASFDTNGNQSDWAELWLYRVTNGPLFRALTSGIFLPFIQH